MIVLWSLAFAAASLLIFDGLAGTSNRSIDQGLRAGLARRLPVRSIPASTLLAASGVVGIAVGSLVGALTGSPTVAVVSALGATTFPFSYASNVDRKRAALARAAWPDALASLIAAVRAGVSLAEACSELGERGPAPLAPGFRAFRGTYRATGSFQAGIGSMRSRLGDPIGDRVSVALTTAHQVGGTDLVRLLRTLSDQIRDANAITTEIEARWSWTVTAARLAAVAPWIVLVLMASRPEGAAAYGTAGGGTVIVVGAAATIVGYRLMLRAARLPQESRLP